MKGKKNLTTVSLLAYKRAGHLCFVPGVVHIILLVSPEIWKADTGRYTILIVSLPIGRDVTRN